MLNINKTIEPEFMKKYKKKYKPKNWADYRNDGIRGKIKKYVGDNEQSYKENYICVYCERKVDLDNNSSHIEHIKPKGAKFSNEFQNYMNLSLCCNSKESCGETKGHKYSDKFVNPVEMNPKDYFTYDEMTLEIISKKSELNEFKNETVDDILKLNNYKLLKARKEVFKMLEQAKQYGYLEHQIESFDQFPTLIEFYKENFL